MRPILQFAHAHPNAVIAAIVFFVLLAIGVIVSRTVREPVLRVLLWILSHSLYRMNVVGRENVPREGGALLVSNHTSFVDVLLLMASNRRQPRFLMFKDLYDHPLLHPFARLVRAIPISPQQKPREMLDALHTASEAIRSGEVVCIFAEGQITRIGQMLPFRRGLQRIMKGVDAPIIPVHIDGMWGSVFSFSRGRFLWKWPKAVPYSVTINYGRPMPATATPADVRTAVQELSAQAYGFRRMRLRPLHRAFIRIARRHPFRFAIADMRIERMSYASALIKAIFLGRRLRHVWRGQDIVAVMLPPSIACALVNIAASLMGKAVVNLNYTVSAEVLGDCMRQIGARNVVTSHAFLEKITVRPPGELVLLEELALNPRKREKIAALLLGLFAPARLIEKTLGRERPASLDELATVVFSSGSTGTPKGVMLSHFNVASNIDQMFQRFTIRPHDCMLSILPTFHAFGYTVTLWLPLATGMGQVFYPNPLDARAIGEFAVKYRATFLLATPTFLQTYTRRCGAEEFGSLNYVIVGAEKLPERVSQAFEEKFGVRPLEGYGCTECAPVVAANTAGFRAAGFHQVGEKRGTIGHPLPGMVVRLLNPDTLELAAPGEAGLLSVRGPNVMMGYLNQPQRTAEVLRDGWYNTGDIATIDEDGFLTISGRLSRFSKIGGEMVPHGRIEEKLHEICGVSEQTFVVTALPDDRKGERVVVLHILPDDELNRCVSLLAGCDLPPLWKPKPASFVRVETLPYLGTGKLDLVLARRLAEAAQPAAAVASAGD
jgi:acyl-[acyl-carrier-protein]-phospholipid O-acyltransferase / long-chain-fatty-acid--[acyl-carrier-protein] ligase